MKNFLVLYMAPARVLEEWMAKDAEYREAEEKKMQVEWGQWVETHKDIFTGPTAGAGKTKRITATGVEDVKNDIMIFSIVAAESQDAAVEIFKGHPHFGIPEATIEIMPVNYMPGMEGK